MKGFLIKIVPCGFLCILMACAGTQDVFLDRGTGWISEDAFRARAAGAAKYETADIPVRKQQALQAAILMCCFIIFEELTSAIARDVKRLSRKEILKRVQNEFGVYVKAGRAVEVKYDGEGICTVLFEIRGEGIKQKFYTFRNRLMVESR